ncbi:hypothetical protein [Colwellia sp. MEBiC06753]
MLKKFNAALTIGHVSAALLFVPPQAISASIAEQLVEIADHNVSYEKSDEKSASEENTLAKPINVAKKITVTAQMLTDNAGLTYVGATVDQTAVAQYLTRLNQILQQDFQRFRQNQINRDHGKFHITLVNPFEIKELTDFQVQSLVDGKHQFEFDIIDLGMVKNETGSAYFVVAESESAEALRKGLQLSAKDFHITLGFAPKDVHGVAKDRTTIVN